MAEVAAPAAARAGAAMFRSIGELAELCGHYCWVERRLFALTGSRASLPASGEPGDPETGDPEIRVVLSQMSARHAFLAAQWRDRLPVRAGVDAEALIVPPPGPAGDALDLIEAAPRLLLVLGGLAAPFLPGLLAGYRRHLAQASPVSEGPVRAVLDWAAASTAGDIELVELLLRRLAGAGGGAEPVADFRALIQRLLGKGADIFPAARAS